MNNPLKKVVESTECVCDRSDGLFIPSRQVSMLLAALLMMFFVTFLSGYFFGKKHMVEQFVAKVEHDSFADQIYSSLCALGDYEPDELRALAAQDQEMVTQEVYEDSIPPEVAPSQLSNADPIEAEVALPHIATVSTPSCDSAGEAASSVGSTYYAQLIGYGTEGAAKQFAHKLAKKDISVEVKRRISKTPKGKSRTWFQVVTHNYSDRDALDKLVDRITKEEKLNGVCIVAC